MKKKKFIFNDEKYFIADRTHKFYNQNPLDIKEGSLCKVIRENENHFFNIDQHIVFTGFTFYDVIEETFFYEFDGKIDGVLMAQHLTWTDFIEIKPALNGSN
jgi:hypothetical protein